MALSVSPLLMVILFSSVSLEVVGTLVVVRSVRVKFAVTVKAHGSSCLLKMVIFLPVSLTISSSSISYLATLHSSFSISLSGVVVLWMVISSFGVVKTVVFSWGRVMMNPASVMI